MKSTRSLSCLWARNAGLIRTALACVWLAAAPAQGADSPMTRPPELERDVQFWVRVYSQIDTNSGFIHDDQNLAVVYDTCTSPPTPLRTNASR